MQSFHFFYKASDLPKSHLKHNFCVKQAKLHLLVAYHPKVQSMAFQICSPSSVDLVKYFFKVTLVKLTIYFLRVALVQFNLFQCEVIGSLVNYIFRVASLLFTNAGLFSGRVSGQEVRRTDTHQDIPVTA